MSILPTDTMTVIAQSVGIPSLPEETASALASDVEYRLRQIVEVCYIYIYI